ncbi:Protease [Altererythrobacter insulae]|nr:Protease [Altererythrobacter insulae]
MSFAGKVWRLLVGIKDGLVLLFMLLFFAILFAVLSARPSPGMVRDGALLLDLDGYVVEERSVVDPFQALLSRQAPVNEFEVHELVRALDAAVGDERIKAVALDLSRFLGGGQVHMQEIGDAIARVRAAEKPVVTFALGYSDDALHLASHASEVWVDPLGGAIVAGPGGSFLMYGELLESFDVNARVYRVGTFKAATEPYTRNTLSPEARENIGGLYASMFEEWQANVKKARPAADLERVTTEPVEWLSSANGDFATAALDAGLVDKVGSRVEWGERLAELSGEDSFSEKPGAFASTDLRPYLADVGQETNGKAIGIITVAGDVVDGELGPGTAGGTRIANLLDDALDEDFAALVVRIDTPGGTMTASEEIRRAILRHKANDIPVVISMANIAASAGYAIASTGDRIFAQPETITGSIGVFSVIPTFEGTAARYGVNADPIRTTPLSGQPDIIGGFTPEVDAILQVSVEDAYRDFLGQVAEGRGMDLARVGDIAQGRVWDGGTARQLGLVDQFGGLQEALEWAAGEAGLEDDGWHAVRLGSSETNYDSLIRQILTSNARSDASAGDVVALLTRQQHSQAERILTDLERLTSVQGVQAYCLECPRETRGSGGQNLAGWLAKLGAFLGT